MKNIGVLYVQEKQLLSKVTSWAVPVVIQDLVKAEERQWRSDSKKVSEGLAEKLTRWLTASLVLGKSASAGKKLGSTKSLPSCLSILDGSHFHPVNKELAIHILQLGVHFSGEGYNLLVTALASLWPFRNSEATTGNSLLVSLILLLTHSISHLLL